MIYDQKGWANGFSYNEDTLENITTDFALNYLSIPLMANWHFGRNSNWNFNFGAYAGFLLNATTVVDDKDVSIAFQDKDFGLSFGFGYKFFLNNYSKIIIEYEAQSGFTDVFNTSAQKITNGRSSLNIGFLYTIN